MPAREALRVMRWAYYARLLHLDLTPEEHADAAVFKLAIDKISADFNTKLRRYVKAYAEHNALPLLEAIWAFVDEHQERQPQHFSFKDAGGNVFEIDTFSIKKPAAPTAKNFTESVTSIGTHSPRYVNSSSTLSPIFHARRAEEEIAVHGNAQLSRFADVLMIQIDDERLLDFLKQAGGEGLSAEKAHGSNHPGTRMLAHVTERLCDITEQTPDVIYDVFTDVSYHYAQQAAGRKQSLSGISGAGKPWSMPTIILPGEDGEDLQASILSAHNLRAESANFKFHIGQIEAALPKSLHKDLAVYVEHGAEHEPLMKAAKKKKMEVEAYVSSLIEKDEMKILAALEEAPENVLNTLTVLDDAVIGNGSLVERVTLIALLTDQVRRVSRMFRAGLSIFANPQNAYKGAQGNLTLIGAAPYFFYKRARFVSGWEDYLSGKKSFVRLNTAALGTAVRRLLLVTFEGDLRHGDDGEMSRSTEVKGVKSGKHRRDASATFADLVLEEAAAGLAETVAGLTAEQKGDLRRRMMADPLLLERSIRSSLSMDGKRQGNRFNKRDLTRVFEARDVHGHLKERMKVLMRGVE